MAGTRQPVDLIQAKGRKHLTKQEIVERHASEVHAPSDKIRPPPYLSDEEKKRFRKISKQLAEIKIMSNLDCDALARYLQSESKYLAYDRLVTLNLQQAESSGGIAGIETLKDLENLRDKAFRQCRTLASDLGLTISSRCKLVIPKQKEAPVSNKFLKFGGGTDRRDTG